MKNLLAPNFKEFREYYQSKLETLFIVPADTFDNVAGKFPIGFFIWNTQKNEMFSSIIANVFNSDGNPMNNKTLSVLSKQKTTIDWLKETRKFKLNKNIAFVACYGCDFQHANYTYIINTKEELASPRGTWVTDANLKEVSVYLAVRKVIPANWINDRDQFLYPNNSWATDEEFHNDCLAFTLFNNNIRSEFGNDWIPFTEQEVNPCGTFESHFMTDYIKGKLKPKTHVKTIQTSLVQDDSQLRVPTQPLEFSDEAKAVFDSGRELWKYYHSKPDANPNAALYDIKEYFQGRNEKGRMNNTSKDEKYNQLMDTLRDKLKILAQKIEPKVYEHGFLLR